MIGLCHLRFAVCVLSVLHQNTEHAVLADDDTTGRLDEKRIFAREITCEDRYGFRHSACLPPSPNLIESGVSESDKQLIVDLHNQERSKVSPSAKMMLKMSWDESIAKIAQAWADTCPDGYDTYEQRGDYGRYPKIGQHYARGIASWESLIKIWAGEKSNYDYTTNSRRNGEAIGHYTQMVWADTFKIGCGYAKCGLPIYICNYGPAGNYYQERPYDAGNTCAGCPNVCKDGLCDCGGMDCFVDGKREFDVAECDCRCKNGLSGPQCNIDCDNLIEPWYCASWVHRCDWHFQFECAFTCGHCKAK